MTAEQVGTDNVVALAPPGKAEARQAKPLRIPLLPSMACAIAISAMLPSPSIEAVATAPYADVWTVYTNGNEIADLAIDPGSQTLWAATSGGIAHWNVAMGDYSKYTTTNGPVDNKVWAVAIDATTGDQWFGTHGGVARPARMPLQHSVFLPCVARVARR